MALLGKAALAMWWDVASDVNAEFQDWHSHEHFRERLAVPGFRRATRWSSADGGEGVFQIYEVDGHEVLSSPQYLAHLNSPTPWSTRLMPHHRNMVRSQCHVLASSGAGLARHALVIRLSPEPGQDAALLTGLTSLLAGLPDQPGCVGAHVLRLIEDLGGMQQGLGGNAADVEADAAENRPALDQHDLAAEVRCTEGGRITTGTGAEHKHLGMDAGLARRGPGLRPRSRPIVGSPAPARTIAQGAGTTGTRCRCAEPAGR